MERVRQALGGNRLQLDNRTHRTDSVIAEDKILSKPLK